MKHLKLYYGESKKQRELGKANSNQKLKENISKTLNLIIKKTDDSDKKLDTIKNEVKNYQDTIVKD